MKTPRVLSFAFTLLCLALSAWLGPNISISAAELISSNSLPSAIADELHRFREEIEQQGQRIDRLYRILRPAPSRNWRLKQPGRKQQEEEDALLLMERIADISDLGLTAGGCGHSGRRKFVAITRAGGIQLIDQEGNPGKRLRAPGHIISSVPVSPTGKEVLTGTETGALLVWDLATGTNSPAYGTNVGRKRVAWPGAWESTVWRGLATSRMGSRTAASRTNP